jgi:hypothetical protein
MAGEGFAHGLRVAHVEDGFGKDDRVALSSHHLRPRAEHDVLQPEVVIERSRPLEERRQVAARDVLRVEAARAAQGAHNRRFRFDRIKIGHALQDRRVLGPQHHARREDVPLDDLSRAETLAHAEALAAPEVEKVQPLVGAHRGNLVEPEVAQAHALEIAALTRAQAVALPAKERLDHGWAAPQAIVEREPFPVGDVALLELEHPARFLFGARQKKVWATLGSGSLPRV